MALKKNCTVYFETADGKLNKLGIIKAAGNTNKTCMNQVFKMVENYLDSKTRKNYYYRLWNEDGYTTIDFGSHTEFFRISPQIEFTKSDEMWQPPRVKKSEVENRVDV